MPDLKDAGIFDDAYDDKDEGAEADYNNLGIGHRQEEGIDYDEVFASVARIKAMRLSLAYALFMDFTVYQMDVKSAFLYGTIEEEVYVCQPSGFVDPEFSNRVYKVEKALYGLHQAHKACVKSGSTPMETHKPLSKDANGTDVDVYLYSLDRKSTTEGYQFLGSRLISWQYKKQTIVVNSTTEAEYIVASNCCRKVIWMIEKLDKDEDVNLVETLLNIRRSSTKDKGKRIMQETKLPKKLKKKEMIQLSLDEELAQKLYAEELAKEVARQDQEMYNLEKALELQRQLDQRKEDVGKGDQAKKIDWNDPIVLRYHAFQNRPFLKAEASKENDYVFKESMRDFEIEKEVMKRAGFDLQQRSSKKQRLEQQTKQTKEEVKAQGDSDKELEEMKLYMRIITDKDIKIDAIPLATKPSVIVEYKIVNEGKISTYLIVRVDGSTKRYTSMFNLHENIDREDLEPSGN
uniref:Copia protein n=1 Tax=Tanacetum cinerariifolium TaxID=118510 RepID=A0A699GYT9_TANCI|nr:copia protein [Tanacetum cinerariifolium]